MKYILLLTAIVFFSSCTSVKIINNRDKEADFSEFKTYSLYPWDKHNDKVVNDYDKLTIINSVKNELNKRGLKYVEKDGDIVVSIFVIIEEKTSYQAYSNHYGGWAGYGGGWGYYGGVGFYGYGMSPGYNSSTVYRTDYNQGTIIFDVLRLKDKKLVWQGIASGEMTENLSQRDRRLPKTIAQIFRRFPITPKSKKKLAEINAENN